MTNAITITRTKNTVKANSYMPNKAYKGFIDEATALKGKIDFDEKRLPKATFNSVEVAEKFATTWRANYNANRKVSVEPTIAPTVKPKASKGKTAPTEELTTVLNGVKYKLVPMTDEAPSSTKKTTAKATAPKKSTTSSKKAPRKTKGNAFDYSVIKGKTNADKNKALHATLVKMGHKDSRTPEYMSIWNARPWAK